MPFSLKMNSSQLPYYAASTSHLGMDMQRAQLQDYAQRLQLGLRSFPGQVSGLNPLAYHGHLMHPYLHPYFCKDPRARFVHEEPKPNHSYIGKYVFLSSLFGLNNIYFIFMYNNEHKHFLKWIGPRWEYFIYIFLILTEKDKKTTIQIYILAILMTYPL